MRWRLSLLMLLLYAVPGSFAPMFSRHLEKLGFTPDQIGRASATQALAALVGPLLVGQIADRWFPPERCLTVAAAGAAIVLWFLADLTHPWAVFAGALGVWFFIGPTLTLSATISFSHLTHPEKEYGRVRLWGTIGWMTPGYLLGLWLSQFPDRLADVFRFGSVFAVVLGLYALTLPRAPRRDKATTWLAPVVALKLLRDRSFAIYVIGSMGLCLALSFAAQGMPLLLRRLGVEDSSIAPMLTIAQIVEVLMLFCLPMLLLRLGMRGTLMLGMGSWAIGMGAFALGRPLPLVLAFLGTWGVMVCCYLVAGQVFVNSRARGEIRASAQALLTCANAVGMLIGNLVAGWIREGSGGELGPMYGFGAALVTVLLILFLVGFREDNGSGTPRPPSGGEGQG